MPHETRHVRVPVVQALSELHAQAIENSAGVGTPDVWTSAGWIELKELDGWPKRPTTKVKINHFTEEQRGWQRKHDFLGNRAFVLIKVGRLEWLLLDGVWAAVHINYCTRQELIQESILYFSSGLKKKELLECLRQEQIKKAIRLLSDQSPGRLVGPEK
jgi:hypothetical protein